MSPSVLLLLGSGSVVFTIWSSSSAASGLGVAAATTGESVASIFRSEEEPTQDTSMKVETKYSFGTSADSLTTRCCISKWIYTSPLLSVLRERRLSTVSIRIVKKLIKFP
jgi:hypothetical protein